MLSNLARRIRPVGIAVVLAATGIAHGQKILRCKQPNGVTVVGNQNSVQECFKNGGVEISAGGTPRGPAPPALSIAEKEAEAAAALLRQEQLARERAAKLEAANLLKQYPDAAALRKAMEEELRPIRASQRDSMSRNDELMKERQRLLTEAEFYKNRDLPSWLQEAFRSNDGQLAGQGLVEKTDLDRESTVVEKYMKLQAQMDSIWRAARR